MSILFEIPGAAVIAALFVADQHVPLLAIPAAVLLLTGLGIVIRSAGRATEPSIRWYRWERGGLTALGRVTTR